MTPVETSAAPLLRLPRSLEPAAAARLEAVLSLLPLRGAPIEVSFAPGLHAHRGKLRAGEGKGTPVHAATFLRQRRMVLESELLTSPAELARIVVHELFHFAWMRLGNPRRRSWEALLKNERRRRAQGELGWSAEWRLRALALRPRLWREYISESFCDTAAFLFARIEEHEEFTLALAFRHRRATWFESELPRPLTI